MAKLQAFARSLALSWYRHFATATDLDELDRVGTKKKGSEDHGVFGLLVAIARHLQMRQPAARIVMFTG